MPTKHQQISDEHHKEINHAILEQRLAGVPGIGHRAMLNEKYKGERLSHYLFAEHHPECILGARYAGSLNFS